MARQIRHVNSTRVTYGGRIVNVYYGPLRVGSRKAIDLVELLSALSKSDARKVRKALRARGEGGAAGTSVSRKPVAARLTVR